MINLCKFQAVQNTGIEGGTPIMSNSTNQDKTSKVLKTNNDCEPVKKCKCSGDCRNCPRKKLKEKSAKQWTHGNGCCQMQN